MITKEESKQLQGLAILAMLCLHLFCTRTPQYTPLLYVTGVPLVYFIGQASDFCVMAYCFCSGYGLMAAYENASNRGEGYFLGRCRSLLRFLLNYWVILFLFGFTSLLLGKGKEWLGSSSVFIGNFITVGYSYNGAWWFVSTYLFMVLLSPFVFKAVKRYSRVTALMAIFAYICGYAIRFRSGCSINIVQHLARLAMSYAELLIGTYFYTCKWMDSIQNVWIRIIPERLRTVSFVEICVVTVIIRRYVPTLFVAPASGMIFIVSYLLIARTHKKPGTIFLFLGKHSINIWLVHMFFYLSRYGGIAYIAKYPVLILIFLLSICICVSYVIKGCMIYTERLSKNLAY